MVLSNEYLSLNYLNGNLYDIPDFLNGDKIIKKDTKDGVKLYLSDNTSWILVRPSGTEPLLRIYFESSSPEKIDSLKQLVNP